MTERDLGTYQMLWDCPFCGTDKLLGLDHRHCPSCGAAQDEDTRYFPTEQDRVPVQDHRYHGVDVDCPSCSTPNAKLANNCVNCGSALAEAEAVHTVDEPKKAASPRPARKKGGLNLGTFILLGIALVGAYIVINTCSTTQVELTAQGRSWQRTIQIERLQDVQLGDWCDRMPADAGKSIREQRVRNQEQVPDGEVCTQEQRDNGDGTFTAFEDCHPKFKSVDVRDDWCRWKGTEWRVSRAEKAQGSSAPTWPDPKINKPGECLGCEREGSRTEVYSVDLSGPDGSTTCSLSEDAWARFETGSRWISEAGALSGNVRCDSLTPAP
jgi:hypothetical protein